MSYFQDRALLPANNRTWRDADGPGEKLRDFVRFCNYGRKIVFALT